MPAILNNPIAIVNENLTLASTAIQGVIVDGTELTPDTNKKVSVNLSGKVDTIAGKGLSTNDFTTVEKTKLAGIEENANNYTLPSDVVQDENYVHTDNNFTTTEKTSLSSHIANTTNPHNVTKTQVGLGNADNTSDIDKPISTATQTALDIINEVIPSQATAENKLADKNFVNSSIATNTATFRGTYTNVESLPTDIDNNDYAFIITTDSDGNTIYNKYKYNGTTWAFEYALNNSSFTAAQWTAIQSGITSSLVASYNAHLLNTTNPHNVTKTQLELDNVNNTSDANKPISNATATALALKEALTNKVTTLSGESTNIEYVSAKAVYDIIVANEQVIAAAIVNLNTRLEAIERLITDGFGKIVVDELQINNSIIKYCTSGNDIISGEGAPTVVPEFVGQCYINTTTGKIYQANGVASAADFGQITN